MQRTLHALMAASTLIAANAFAQARLPTIPPAHYTPEQKQAATDFEAARKAPVFGPFAPLMHGPEMMTLSRSMGDYLRCKSSVGNTLSELVILVTARAWTQDFEWTFHRPIAIKADFATELIRNKRVSDTTFEKVKARFGTKGVVDTSGIVGYYTFLAMQLNVAQYRNPNDPGRLPRLPE